MESDTVPPPTAVTYIGLPIGSGGAHGLGRIGVRAAYERTLAFVGACVVVDGATDPRFTIQHVPSLQDPRIWEPPFRERFGGGTDRLVAVSENRVDEAITFLEQIHPQPQNQWGMAPLWLSMHWDIALVDPRSGQPFAGQDPSRYAGVTYEGVPLGASRLRLMLSNSASLGVTLCLPDIDDDGLRLVIPWLQEHAPFRFAAKHWKRWTPTKSGSFIGRKIQPLG